MKCPRCTFRMVEHRSAGAWICPNDYCNVAVPFEPDEIKEVEEDVCPTCECLPCDCRCEKCHRRLSEHRVINDDCICPKGGEHDD